MAKSTSSRTASAAKRGPKAAQSPRSPRALRSLSISDLQAELRRRQSASRPLARRRERLAQKLAAIDAELARLGVSTSGGGSGLTGRRGPRGPRVKNSLSLVESLKKVMTGKVLSVGEAADAVLALGYRTNSANFRTVVNQTLLVNKGSFKSPERGRYTAK